MQITAHNNESSLEITKNYLHTIANCILHPIRTYNKHKSEVARAVAELNQVRDLAETSRQCTARRRVALQKIISVEASIEYLSESTQRKNQQDVEQLDIEAHFLEKIYHQQGEMNEPEQETKGDIVHQAEQEIQADQTVEQRLSYIDDITNKIAERTSAFQDASALAGDLAEVKRLLENSTPDCLVRYQVLIDRVEAYNQNARNYNHIYVRL